MKEKVSKVSKTRSMSTGRAARQEQLFDRTVFENVPAGGAASLLDANTRGDISRPLNSGDYLPSTSNESFGSFVLDVTGSILQVDANGAELAQAVRETLLHSSFLLLVDQESRKTFLTHLEQVIAKGETRQWDFSFLRSDGFDFDARLHASPALGNDADGWVHCVVTDITQQKRLLKIVRESEERYKTVAKYSTDGIAILKQGIFLYANPAFLTIFDHESEAQLIGQSIGDLVIPVDRGRMAEITQTIHCHEYAPCHFEFRGLRKDGTIVHIEALGAKTVYHGEPAELMCLRDVGEKIRAEEERRRLALIIEQAAEVILVTDRSGVLRYANLAFLRHTGRKREEIIGKQVADLSIRDEDKGFFVTLATKLQRERRWSGRLTLIQQAGGPSEFAVNVWPMRDQAGLVSDHVITCRDVTIEAVLEEQLRQAHKMEAIGTLAGGIAHDFNNILAAIIGNAELALDDIPQESAVRYNLEQIFNASQRAKDLVKQILAFSRRDHQEPILVHAVPLVVETMKLLRSSIPATIDMRHRVEAERDTILADAGRLQQILMNLCSNAAHAMREAGGVLEVTVKEYQADNEASHLPNLKSGPYLIIEVKDTGHGIPKNVIERIFDPFFTTKRPGEGTGMGLAVVHGIVRSLNGAITVSSTPGKGSVFMVYLPVAISVEQQTVEKESLEPPGGREHILFVDDEAPIVEMNGMLLKRLGYEITAVTSSVEALALFSRTPRAFDLVITDVTMPELNGTELSKKLRSIRKDIPIILVTGFSETVNAEQARKMGIQQMLMKPLVKRELTDAIRKVLDARKKRH